MYCLISGSWPAIKFDFESKIVQKLTKNRKNSKEKKSNGDKNGNHGRKNGRLTQPGGDNDRKGKQNNRTQGQGNYQEEQSAGQKVARHAVRQTADCSLLDRTEIIISAKQADDD